MDTSKRNERVYTPETTLADTINTWAMVVAMIVIIAMCSRLILIIIPLASDLYKTIKNAL